MSAARKIKEVESLLAEDIDLEIKRATGRDGTGELPQDFWETYSGMANSEGGKVLLGIEERPPGSFRIVGITNTERVVRQIWDRLNDRDFVSCNLLRPEDVTVTSIEGRQIISISIPRANRFQRPVHLKKNPFGNSYRRNSTGDYRLSDESVRRMLADRVEESRDSAVLSGFGIADLDEHSLRAYRNEFTYRKPHHPFNVEDQRQFLYQIGVWRKDRETGREGLTIAGLLMFGKWRAITEQFPNYQLDYQEKNPRGPEDRWIDRVTTDGSWSGNVYDFYRIVIQRLFRDVHVPFIHEGESRKYQTGIHEALQEALTNALIHADYTGRVSVLIVKRPDLFGFRNPGTMRVPIREAIRGGHTDCRNKNLQTLFQLIGYGDKAGSGIPTIFRNWTREQHYQPPLLSERYDPEQTLLTLPLSSLVREETLQALESRFGNLIRALTETERVCLFIAESEGRVTHRALASRSSLHPHDVSATLKGLVARSFLVAHGVGRGTYYTLPGTPVEFDLIDFANFASGQLEPTLSNQLTPINPHSRVSNPHLLEEGTADWGQLLREHELIRKTKRCDLTVAILGICSRWFVTARQLGKILGREPASLKNIYLRPLVAKGRMQLLYPENPAHRGQAYRTVSPE